MIKLEYGMKILYPYTDTDMVETEVSKYWKTDTDANSYKVKLIPISDKDKERFGNERLYSSDLRSLISSNVCKIIN